MIRLLTAVFLFASFNAVAQTQVPNVFEDGTPASAAEVNANFDAIEAALPPTNCTADQIIKWDDTNDAWVCATGDLAGLVCEEEDTITFRNGTWQCSSATPPEEPCTTYYRDYDNDGYGTPTSSQCLSSPTGYYTATNSSDCFDNNADVNPAQTEWFSSDRGDGSYDYDCDGQQEKLYYAVGSCQIVGTGCDYNLGWSGGSVPSCGSARDWITACEFQFEFTGPTCIEDTTTRIQTCQ
ncbi:hypothetical protein N9U42_05165 [Luminiphilus sp.]|nr:hypothetical protein [Luminiphilus sp.]MDA9711733.1 hypothetical protein [Luminiphilus sp.]